MLCILILLLQPGQLYSADGNKCTPNPCNSNAICHTTCPGGKWLNMKGFPVLCKCTVLNCVLQSTCLSSFLLNHQPLSQVTQSSVAYNGVPEKAIDGNRNNNFEHGHSCSHTKRHANHPSWTVTLPTQHHIAVVKVTDRLEARDRGRLNGFSIHVLDTIRGRPTRCATKVQITNGETKAIVCNAVGNKIKITAREYLVLCT